MNPYIDCFRTKKWYNEKKQLHRLDGPALETIDGDKYWYINGKFHREDGPAIEWCDGSKHWFVNGLRHREDGPAIEYTNGYKEWVFWGKDIYCSSQEEFEKIIKLRMFW